MAITSLRQMFFFGVASSLAGCMFTCWPVFVAFVAARSRNIKESIFSALVFSLARIIVYILMGALVGAVGGVFVRLFDFHREFLGYGSGGILVAVGVWMFFSKRQDCRSVCSYNQKFYFLAGVRRSLFAESFLMGVFFGAIPCVPFFAALSIISFSAGGWGRGALLGGAFGIGALFSPMVAVACTVGILPQRLVANKKLSRFLQDICAIIISVVGIRIFVFTILR